MTAGLPYNRGVTVDQTQTDLDLALYADRLRDWVAAMEPWWVDEGGGLGCFGTGYSHWGVQTNLKYAAAVAVLSTCEGVDRSWCVERALSAFRFAWATHRSGDRPGPDGRPWGCSWISPLGFERALHGWEALGEARTDTDRAAVRRVMAAEANWMCDDYEKNGHRGVIAGRWNDSGRNTPESNLWTGALLWRASRLMPGHERAADWAERAHDFLINAVSVAADADDPTPVAGRPVRDRHVDSQFFDHYALDHHGYFNVGYMVICASQAAIFHFDLKAAGWERPESLDHHQSDLWGVLRRMVFADGRLARLGGDTRVRYAYCQPYLVPALLYAADRLGDAHAVPLVARCLDLHFREAAHNADGSFYSRRLAPMRAADPYYYLRLESDVASTLGMALAYAPLTDGAASPDASDPTAFEASVQGGWHEPEYGAVLHRCPTRLASFAWRAQGLAQAVCQPPDDGDLCEWRLNLCPVVRYLGDHGVFPGGKAPHRRLLGFTSETFDGGFVTAGSVMEGVDLVVREGGACTDMARTWIAFAALPDGRTCVGLQRVVAEPDRRGYTLEVKGLHLNVPNDLFNADVRIYHTSAGVRQAVVPTDDIEPLNSRWLNIDGRVGVVGVYGDQTLRLDRSATRRGGKLASLFVDEINFGGRDALTLHRAGDVLLDIGFVVLSDADAQATARVEAEPIVLDAAPEARGLRVVGQDGVTYEVLANFGEAGLQWNGDALPIGAARLKTPAGVTAGR